MVTGLPVPASAGLQARTSREGDWPFPASGQCDHPGGPAHFR